MMDHGEQNYSLQKSQENTVNQFLNIKYSLVQR